MKILDWYILKRYFATFGVLMFLFIPIGISANLAEKFNRIVEAPLGETLLYYLDFTIFFANMLFPILLFISTIWFTSKLADNTEIVAFLSSGVSFSRFLRPYIIGASIVCLIAMGLSTYFAPEASKGYNEYVYTYLKGNPQEKKNQQEKVTEDIYRQINKNEFLYVGRYYENSKRADNFVLEYFEDNQLKHKITASNFKYNEEDSSFTLYSFKKRILTDTGDVLKKASKIDTVLTLNLDDLATEEYIAETLNYAELLAFIEQQKLQGAGNINRYKVEAYRRWSVPISAFILTLIAVSVSSVKRRGGIGINLMFGIVIAFSYVFMDKVFGTIAEKSTFSPLLAVWIPNIVFGILGIYLLQRAKR